MWQHLPHWRNWEMKGFPLPQWMFHGTTNQGNRYIDQDQEIKPGCMTSKGNWGKLHAFYALVDPISFALGGRFKLSARTTEGNEFRPYPFGKKNEPKTGCLDIVQAWNAWRVAALGGNIYISPVHCALMDVRLATGLMAQTYCGWTGCHDPCNNKYWPTREFGD